MMNFTIDKWRTFTKNFRMNPVRSLIALFLLIACLIATPLRAGDAPFRHFVSFQFKDGTTTEQKAEIVKAFLALKGEISTIRDLEWGESENLEPLADGFTHSFLVSFNSKEGLATYLPHPAHQAFVAKLKPLLAKVYVFDYTAKR